MSLACFVNRYLRHFPAEERFWVLCSTALPVALLTTLLRFAVNKTLCLAQLGRATPRSTLTLAVEEGWLLVTSMLLLGLSTWAVQFHNGQCTLFNQTECFANWPRTENSEQASVALAAFLGWYIHGVLKSFVPGVGLRSGASVAGLILHYFSGLALDKFQCYMASRHFPSSGCSHARNGENSVQFVHGLDNAFILSDIVTLHLACQCIVGRVRLACERT